MTGCYRLEASAAEAASALGAHAGEDPWVGGAVVPTGYAPVVIRDPEWGRQLVPRQWGVPPPPKGQRTVPHVRNLESPFWIGTLRHPRMRCLVPATHFRGSDGGAGRPPRWFTVTDAPIFAMAGIWRDSEVPSFAILTDDADRSESELGLATVPVILHRADFGRWLGTAWKEAQELVWPDRMRRARLQAVG